MTILKKLCIKYKYQLINLLGHSTFIIYSIFIPYYFFTTLFIGWILNNIFNYLFIHRIYSHRHFKLNDAFNKVALFIFSMMNLGSPPIYAATHYKHHLYSGTKNDPHDPYHVGFVRTFFSLWTDTFSPNQKIFSKLMKDKVSKWYHINHVYLSFGSAIFFPFLIVVPFWFSKIVIMIVHLKNVGYQNFKLDDNSKNVWWLKLLCWGEELHNNHHKDHTANNHNFSKNIKEFDLLFYIGKSLEICFPYKKLQNEN